MAKQTVIVSVLADTSRFTRGMQTVGSKLGTVTSKMGSLAKIGGATLLGLTTGVAALAVKGGISRSLKLEEAQKKLEALGASADVVSQVSKDALASVKGTAFGLDAAATAASSAMAAGIQPGKDMSRYLSLVADTAQIAGTSMEDMGAIFGKVATNQKVTTTEMNQLADKGIPIWTYLADAYGVSTEELRKMVTAGKVDLSHFLDAVETNIGGAGKIMADTTSGSWKNMLAALSRFGQIAVSPVFPYAKTVFQEATVAIDTLTTALQPAADKLSEFLGPRITEALSGIGERASKGILSAVSTISGLSTQVMAVYSAVLSRVRTSDVAQGILSNLSDLPAKLTPVVSTLASNLGDKLHTVLGILTPILSNLADVFTTTLWPALQEILPTVADLVSNLSPLSLIFQALAPIASSLGESLGSLAQVLGTALATALPAILPAIQALAEALGGALAQALPSISALIADLAATFAGTLATALTTILPALAELVGALVTSLAPVLPTLAGLIGQLASSVGTILTGALAEVLPMVADLVATLVRSLVPVLPSLTVLISGVADVAAALVSALVPILPVIIQLATTLIGALIPILPSLGQLLATVAQVLGTLLTALAPLLPAIGSLISTGLTVLVTALTPIIDIVSMLAQVIVDVLIVALQVIQPVIAVVVGAISVLAQVLTSVLAGGVQVVSTIITTSWRAIATLARTVWTGIATLIKTVVGGISTAISGFVSGVTRTMSGGWSAITGVVTRAWSGMTGAISRGVSTAVSTVAQLPSRAAAALGNLGSSLANAGRSLIQGFIDGITEKFANVKETLGNLTSKLTSWKGPKSLDRVLLTDNGHLIIDGFIKGLEDRYGDVRDSLNGLTGTVSGTNMGTLALPDGPTGARAATYTINVYALTPTAEIGRVVVDAIRQYERLNGAGR